MHINEQTTFSIKKILKKHGFRYHVWIEGGWEIGEKSTRLQKMLIEITKLWPFKPFWFNDIYALAWKKMIK
jgi:hypothetical protein